MNHDFASRFSLFFLFSHLRASDFFRCHTCNHHISLQCPLTSSFPEKKISSLQNKYEILLTKPARTARLLHTLPTYKSAGKLPSNRAVKRGREKTEKCSSEMLSFSPCFFCSHSAFLHIQLIPYYYKLLYTYNFANAQATTMTATWDYKTAIISAVSLSFF